MKNKALLFIIICFQILSCNNAQKNNSVDMVQARNTDTLVNKNEIKIFMNDTIANSKIKGYGYDILINGMHIYQPSIPAINGLKGFLTVKDARKTAEYVAKKLKETNSLPALSKQELDSLGISY